jgi:hypothetical protein
MTIRVSTRALGALLIGVLGTFRPNVTLIATAQLS